MSSSSIYGIKKDYTGEEILEYKNSWYFSPIIWSVLPDKYIHDYIQTPYGYKKGIIGMDGNDVWIRTNIKLSMNVITHLIEFVGRCRTNRFFIHLTNKLFQILLCNS